MVNWLYAKGNLKFIHILHVSKIMQDETSMRNFSLVSFKEFKLRLTKMASNKDALGSVVRKRLMKYYDKDAQFFHTINLNIFDFTYTYTFFKTCSVY